MLSCASRSVNIAFKGTLCCVLRPVCSFGTRQQSSYTTFEPPTIVLGSFMGTLSPKLRISKFRRVYRTPYITAGRRTYGLTEGFWKIPSGPSFLHTPAGGNNRRPLHCVPPQRGVICSRSFF